MSNPTRNLFGLATLCSLTLTSPVHAATFISEYVEGSSNNKAIEIINTGDQVVDLSQCQLLRYSNGSSNGVSIPLKGMLGSNAVHVVCHPKFDPEEFSVCDQSDANLNFNGNDAVELRCDGSTLDVVGQIGSDPGTQWGSGETSTQDNTLCRKATVRQGDTNGTDSFVPAEQWIGSARDFLGGLGDAGLCGDGGSQGLDCSASTVTIGSVQGQDAQSPVQGSVQTVRGVVSASYPALNGFFLQNTGLDADGDPDTSDAIWIASESPVSVNQGQVLVVRGLVTEQEGRTQIELQEMSESCGSDTVGVTSIDPGEVDTWERYEGMLVRPSRNVTISGNYKLERYNELIVADGGLLMQPTELHLPGPDAVAQAAQNARRSFVIDDSSNVQNLFPLLCEGGLDARGHVTCRAGSEIDAQSVQGPLDYDHGSFRIRDTDSSIRLATQDPRPRSNPDVGSADVRLGVFNVFNYFVTLDQGGALCGPLNLGCRGADSAQEYERQVDKLVFALNKLGADVIALQEVENPRGGQRFESTAVQDLVNRLNALPSTVACGRGEWKAVNPGGPLGTDAISNGIIYCADDLVLLDVDVLDDSDLPELGLSELGAVFDGKSTNRVVLGARFQDVANDQDFAVAVTHQKSKGASRSFRSDCADTGAADPNCDQGDGAGYYNQMRTHGSTAIRTWLETSPKLRSELAIVVGDMNSYSQEAPVRYFVDAGYVSVAAQEAPSYAYDGAWGHLDHALANAALAPRVTGAKYWNINAREPSAFDYNTEYKGSGSGRELEAQATYYRPDEYRSSDHNPLLVGLCLRENCGSAPAPRPPSTGAPMPGGCGLGAPGVGLIRRASTSGRASRAGRTFAARAR